MALRIRLRQQGRTNRLTYRLVVAEASSPRDGKYHEMVGYYNPHAEGEKELYLHEDRIQYWVDQGAMMTEKAEKLVKRGSPGVIRVLREKRRKKSLRRTEKRKKAGAEPSQSPS